MLRTFHAGVVLVAQSTEGLHDDPAERDRLLNSASTLIAHRLADPDPIVTRAGTIRAPTSSTAAAPPAWAACASRTPTLSNRTISACYRLVSPGSSPADERQRWRYREGGGPPSRRSPQRDPHDGEVVGPAEPALPTHRAGSAGPRALDGLAAAKMSLPGNAMKRMASSRPPKEGTTGLLWRTVPPCRLARPTRRACGSGESDGR